MASGNITQDPLNPHQQHLATPYGTASAERWLGEGGQDAPDRETIIDGKLYIGPDPMKQYIAEHYFGWLPMQKCMICGAWYWGGFPRWEVQDGKLVNTWQASWMDYCSRACCDKDLDRLL